MCIRDRVFSFLPVCIKKFRKIELLMTLSNCFTAGLFLATGMVHILPESNENITEGMAEAEDEHAGHDHGDHDDHGEGGHDHGISYAHLTLLLAFSFLLFIEKVLLNRNYKKKKEE